MGGVSVGECLSMVSVVSVLRGTAGAPRYAMAPQRRRARAKAPRCEGSAWVQQTERFMFENAKPTLEEKPHSSRSAHTSRASHSHQPQRSWSHTVTDTQAQCQWLLYSL